MKWCTCLLQIVEGVTIACLGFHTAYHVPSRLCVTQEAETSQAVRITIEVIHLKTKVARYLICGNCRPDAGRTQELQQGVLDNFSIFVLKATRSHASGSPQIAM